MKRRQVLKAAIGGVATGMVLARPAIAQSMPEIKWRMTSSFPKTLDTIFGAADVVARSVAEATDNRFTIQVFAPGEIVGGLQALDAVSNGTVEMAHTASSYFIGKNPAFAFGSVIPFSLNARQMNAWLYYGGGNEMLNKFYASYGVRMLPGGNTGCQMAGWFRKEVKSIDDIKGLKMRIPAIQGQVMQRLGAVPQQIAGGDVYPSLERGTIDAAEWVGPYDDEKLGFYRVAPYYYYPGWWEGGPALNFFINSAQWETLPKAYQSLLVTAAERANADMLAKYDARNPAALRRLVAAGAKLRPFSMEILEAAYKASEEVLTEIASGNADFKAMYDSMLAFRADQYQWWQVAEFNFDYFMIRSRQQQHR